MTITVRVCLTMAVIAGIAEAADAQAVRDTVTASSLFTRDGLDVMPSAALAYEDNVFRTKSGKVDDFILTPSVEGKFSKGLGLGRVGIDGLFGYDVFAKQKQLDKPHFTVNGGATIGLVGACTISPSGFYRQQRSDYGDINDAVNNTQRYSDLNAVLSCERPAGFYPDLSYERSTTRNTNRFDYADQTTSSVTAGAGYRQPSLGDLLLYYRHDSTDRLTLNLHNYTSQAGLSFVRAISSKLQAGIDVQWLWVHSTDALIRDYKGPGWKIELSSRALPGVLVKFDASRKIVNDSLVASGFVIQSDYNATMQANLSSLTSASVILDYRRRRFRQAPNILQTSLASDNSLIVTAGVSRRLSQTLRLSLDLTHDRRRTNTGLSNYAANRVALTLNAAF